MSVLLHLFRKHARDHWNPWHFLLQYIITPDQISGRLAIVESIDNSVRIRFILGFIIRINPLFGELADGRIARQKTIVSERHLQNRTDRDSYICVGDVHRHIGIYSTRSRGAIVSR